MKKLLSISIILAVSVAAVLSVFEEMEVLFDFQRLAQACGVFIGWSMAVVGIISVILSAAFTEGKERIYQGAFFTLLGISISTLSLTAFIAAIILVGWLDLRGRTF
jgi:hypothetical protein